MWLSPCYSHSIYKYHLDLEVGEERIVPEDIGFKEPEFVCEPGAVIRGKTCGKMMIFGLYFQNFPELDL